MNLGAEDPLFLWHPIE